MWFWSYKLEQKDPKTYNNLSQKSFFYKKKYFFKLRPFFPKNLAVGNVGSGLDQFLESWVWCAKYHFGLHFRHTGHEPHLTFQFMRDPSPNKGTFIFRAWNPDGCLDDTKGSFAFYYANIMYTCEIHCHVGQNHHFHNGKWVHRMVLDVFWLFCTLFYKSLKIHK